MTTKESVPQVVSDRALLDVRGLQVRFGGKKGAARPAVDHVGFAIERGRTLGLIGESGSGKSTVCKTLAGLVRPTAGTALLDGEDLLEKQRRSRSLTRKVQMIFQDPFSSLDPGVRIVDSIREPLRVNRIGSPREQRDRAGELLKLVGLNDTYLTRFPHQMSGGQLQRVAIARALALEPQLLLADEPLSALDVSIQAQVSNLLMNVQQELGVSYLFIGHDLAAVRRLSDSVAVMFSGRIVESGDATAVYGGPQHPYTLALMSAVPELTPASARPRITVARTSSAPSDTGCSYRSRCWLYESLGRPQTCATDDPNISEREGQSVACHYSSEVSSQPVYERVLTGTENNT